MIFNKKNFHYNQPAQKLNDPKTISETYWGLLKNFYDGKKVPLVPPLPLNNKLEPDFKLKAKFLNKFFGDKYTAIQNNIIHNFVESESQTCNRLASIAFNDESILKIIRALDINKAHGHDDTLIWMITSLWANQSFQEYC